MVQIYLGRGSPAGGRSAFAQIVAHSYAATGELSTLYDDLPLSLPLLELLT
jgi:hypothetical protein